MTARLMRLQDFPNWLVASLPNGCPKVGVQRDGTHKFTDYSVHEEFRHRTMQVSIQNIN